MKNYWAALASLLALAGSSQEVIALVNALVKRNSRVITLKQNLDSHQQDINFKIIIALFSLFFELERDLISFGTKEALSAKKMQGQLLGKLKGTLQRSKFNNDVEESGDYWAMDSRSGKSPESLAIPTTSH